MFDIDLVEISTTRSLVIFIFRCGREVFFYPDGIYSNQFRCDLHEHLGIVQVTIWDPWFGYLAVTLVLACGCEVTTKDDGSPANEINNTMCEHHFGKV